MAKLYFEYGSMGSGKTTRLLQTANNYEQNGKKVIIIKPCIDTKGGDEIVSRIGLTRKVDILIRENESVINRLTKVLDDSNIFCIIVDESQFLTEKQVDEFLVLAVNWDIPVVCYGLRTDFRTKMFSGSKRLFEVAHSLKEIKTICAYCNKKAVFNARMVAGSFVNTGNTVAIDLENDVSYESLCAKCYLKKVGAMQFFQSLLISGSVFYFKNVKILKMKKQMMDFGNNIEPKTDFVLFEKIIYDRGSKYSVSYGKVENRDQIKKFLKKLKANKKYVKATHNSWACVISKDGVLYETKSDDGETGAGNVILSNIKKNNVVNVVVCVTRWFGGVKLQSGRFKHLQDATLFVIKSIKNK